MDIVGPVQGRHHEDVWGTGASVLWEGSRAGSVQLGEEEAQGDLTGVCTYLEGGCKEDVVRVFSVVQWCSDGGDNGLKLKYWKFCFNMRAKGNSLL